MTLVKQITAKLLEFMERMKIFCEKQDRTNQNVQQALYLITEINQDHLGKEGSSSVKSDTLTLSGQRLLSIIEPVKGGENVEQTLELYRSIARRRQSQITFVKPTAYMPAIGRWLEVKGSTLLYMTARSIAEDHVFNVVVQLVEIYSGTITDTTILAHSYLERRMKMKMIPTSSFANDQR